MPRLDNMNNISVIIPAKDEERTIGEVIKKTLFITDNIIVIDDSSRDATFKIAKQYNVTVMAGPNKGKGALIRFAINNVKSDILVFIDADGSHDPQDIPKLVSSIVEDKADMVIASRITGGSGELGGCLSNLIRLFGNLLSTYIVNLLWGNGIKLTDVQNGFKAIKRNVVVELNLCENSFAIEQELVIKCLKKGFKILEIPSYETKRLHGKSHLNPVIMLPKYIWCFVRNLW